MGDVLDASFKTLFDKIAAELFDKTHVRTVMLSLKMETVFFERYAGVRLV